MNNYTLSELSKSLHNGNLSSVELTQYYLDLIKIHNGRLNAFITVNEENAMIQAQVADQRLQQGTAGILTGIPIAHKDIFCTKGVRTSCASKMLEYLELIEVFGTTRIIIELGFLLAFKRSDPPTRTYKKFYIIVLLC